MEDRFGIQTESKPFPLCAVPNAKRLSVIKFALHQYSSGSMSDLTPYFLFALYSAPKCFYVGFPVYPPPQTQKSTFDLASLVRNFQDCDIGLQPPEIALLFLFFSQISNVVIDPIKVEIRKARAEGLWKS